MRFNEKQLILMSSGQADFEGRLHYKKVWMNSQYSKGFKEKWFKLKANILFYFKLNETRQQYLKQPSGLFVLEDSEVHYENDSETPFGFSITFRDDAGRKHLFGARSESDVADWMYALNRSTYGHMRCRLLSLQQKIKEQSEIKEIRRINSKFQLPLLVQPKPLSADGENSTSSSERESNFNLIQL